MTATAEHTTTDPDPHATAPDATAPDATELPSVAGVSLVWLDPRELLDHPRNVRRQLGDLTGLTASIREDGVIEPLSVIPDPDGGYVIDAGHRRKHAAIAADAARVPCVLRPDVAADDDDRAGQARQIARKVAENVHRDGITTGEEAAAYQAMLDLGVKPTAIARQTGQPRRRVLAGLGVARAELGDRADAAALTLDQAAAVAAYADDEQTTATLIEAAADGDGHFKHAVSRAKEDRTRARNLTAAFAGLTEAGTTVIEPLPRWDYRGPVRAVERLTHDGQPLSVEAHAACPGHGAYAAAESWSTDVHVTYVCTDPAAHGHTDPYASSRPAAGERGGPMTEAQKAARKELIANNKAMVAATEVRREFVRGLLARRAAPKGSLRYVTDVLTGETHQWLLVRWYNGMPNAAEAAVREALPAPRGPVPDARLPLALLAQVGGAIETTIHPDTWRRPDATRAGWLRYLVSAGYEPADVERIILDHDDPADDGAAVGDDRRPDPDVEAERG